MSKETVAEEKARYESALRSTYDAAENARIDLNTSKWNVLLKKLAATNADAYEEYNALEKNLAEAKKAHEEVKATAREWLVLNPSARGGLFGLRKAIAPVDVAPPQAFIDAGYGHLVIVDLKTLAKTARVFSKITETPDGSFTAEWKEDSGGLSDLAGLTVTLTSTISAKQLAEKGS